LFRFFDERACHRVILWKVASVAKSPDESENAERAKISGRIPAESLPRISDEHARTPACGPHVSPVAITDWRESWRSDVARRMPRKVMHDLQKREASNVE
jgi:hypothetical protein